MLYLTVHQVLQVAKLNQLINTNSEIKGSEKKKTAGKQLKEKKEEKE